MKVLVACEESQAVCKAFRERGHEAFSCDIQPCSGGHPEWHIQADVLPLLNGCCTFTTVDTHTHTQDGKWDLIIAHPPCTDLAVSGARWFREKQKSLRQQKAVAFFMHFVLADCERIAVENPVGIMSTVYKKPTQIIQPYMFGDSARKTTCLWLKGLDKLQPTEFVDPGEIKKGGFSVGASLDAARDENGKMIAWNDPRTAKIRSRTFPGIAKAMAEQWAGERSSNRMTRDVLRREVQPMKTVQTVSYSLSERVAQLVAEFAERNHISKSAAAAVLLTEGAAILSRDTDQKEA